MPDPDSVNPVPQFWIVVYDENEERRLLIQFIEWLPFPAQKYEKLYESLIPLKMESLEEILITSDGEEEQEQELTTTSVQSAEPRATSPSSCNHGPSSSSPLREMSSLPAEPVFQCPLDSCNFSIAQEVRLSTKIFLY